MMIMMIMVVMMMVGTTLNPRRRHGNLPTRGRARRVEYDFHVASRGFGVVPSVVVAAVIIVIIIIRMDHEHPSGPMVDITRLWWVYLHGLNVKNDSWNAQNSPLQILVPNGLIGCPFMADLLFDFRLDIIL